MDSYTLLVVIFILVSTIGVYIFFINEKSKKFQKIGKGICPQCNLESIEVKNSKKNGCCGTSAVTFKCRNCGYEDEYNIGNGGSCKL